MLHETIQIDDPEKLYYSVLTPETVQKDRFSVDVSYTKPLTIVTIQASDAVSLKAITTSLLLIIEMTEKTQTYTTRDNDR